MKNNSTQHKFKEGETHLFTIDGFTEIPGTEESFYILRNQSGGKHLLKSNHYKHYNLKVDQEIKCKIDKINCSGKIYLEPQNPIYKAGQTYSFDFIKIIDHVNSVGENEKAAVVRDQFGIETLCSLPYDFDINVPIAELKCKVLRIKKGQLFLSYFESNKINSEIEIGQILSFTVKEIKQLEEQTEYYILKDEFDNSYSLKKDMYQHYGFIIGDTIKCTTTKYNTDGHIKIEPVHPYYKVGEYYLFKYLKTITEIDPLGNKESVILVSDYFNVDTKVRSQNIDANQKFGEFVECRVDGIRKGKAILSLA